MRMFEEVMNKGDLQAVDELVADDRLTDPPGFPSGKEGLRALASMYRSGAPDLHMTVEQIMQRETRLRSAGPPPARTRVS